MRRILRRGNSGRQVDCAHGPGGRSGSVFRTRRWRSAALRSSRPSWRAVSTLTGIEWRDGPDCLPVPLWALRSAHQGVRRRRIPSQGLPPPLRQGAHCVRWRPGVAVPLVDNGLGLIVVEVDVVLQSPRVLGSHDLHCSLKVLKSAGTVSFTHHNGMTVVGPQSGRARRVCRRTGRSSPLTSLRSCVAYDGAVSSGDDVCPFTDQARFRNRNVQPSRSTSRCRRSLAGLAVPRL